MKNKEENLIKNLMNDACEQAGCTKQQTINHAWKWAVKRWHSHPSIAFTNWWKPTKFDPVSGAHVGGHPDAHRRWARKDPNGWKHRWYGVSILDAWNTAHYVEQFNAWEQAGSPDRPEPFVSIAATLERQKQYWHDAKPLMLLFGSGAKRKQIDPLAEELMEKYPGYDPNAWIMEPALSTQKT